MARQAVEPSRLARLPPAYPAGVAYLAGQYGVVHEMRDLSHGRLVLGRIHARIQQVTVMLPVSMPRRGAAALPGVEALTAASVVRRIDARARCKQPRRFGNGSLLHEQRQLPAAASTVKRLQHTAVGNTHNI